MKKKILMPVLIICLLLCACQNNEHQTKNITVTVCSDKGKEEFSVSTDEKFLGDALKNEGLIEGENSEYGIFIKSVNGIKADESKEQWWCITKDGENVMTGADSTPIEDGDRFELTLKTGY